MKSVWVVWACLPAWPADCSPFNSHDQHLTPLCCCWKHHFQVRSPLRHSTPEVFSWECCQVPLERAFIPSLHVGAKTRLCWDYFEFSGSANLARDMPWFLLAWFVTSPRCLSPFLCECKCINTATSLLPIKAFLWVLEGQQDNWWWCDLTSLTV